MGQIKNTWMLLTILCLSSCNSVERAVICKEIDTYQIRPTVNLSISIKRNHCMVKCFDFNSWKSLKFRQCNDLNGIEFQENSKGEQYALLPLIACDEVTGFDLSDAAKNIRPNVKALNEVKKKLCK